MPVQWTISTPHRLVIADALPYREIFDTTQATVVLSDADMMAPGARVSLQVGKLGPLGGRSLD